MMSGIIMASHFCWTGFVTAQIQHLNPLLTTRCVHLDFLKPSNSTNNITEGCKE